MDEREFAELQRLAGAVRRPVASKNPNPMLYASLSLLALFVTAISLLGLNAYRSLSSRLDETNALITQSGERIAAEHQSFERMRADVERMRVDQEANLQRLRKDTLPQVDQALRQMQKEISERASFEDARSLFWNAIDADARGDHAAALRMYERLKQMPANLRPPDLEQRLAAARLSQEQTVSPPATPSALFVPATPDNAMPATPATRPAAWDWSASPPWSSKSRAPDIQPVLPPNHEPYGRVKRIAFVCDASASMLSKFSTLRREVSKSIHSLKREQSFSVIFFQKQTCVYLDQGMLTATPDAKLRADKFLETVTPREETDPIPALELAFKQKPELIILMSDGGFPDNAALLSRIHELDKDGEVKINTVAFIADTDTDTEYMALLKKIAHETGGVYRYIRESDL